jgi:hypothetical protein
MITAAQKASALVGKEGCFFITECYIAEYVNKAPIDILDMYEKALRAKIIRANCFIESHAGLMSFLTGKRWKARFEDNTNYVAKQNEFIVQGWVWGNLGHWIFGGQDNLPLPKYDPLGDTSPVVFNGRLNKLLVLTLEETI